jgi:hypothetical protein
MENTEDCCVDIQTAHGYNRKEVVKRRYDKNRKKIQARDRARYAKNKKKVLNARKIYYQKNKAKIQNRNNKRYICTCGSNIRYCGKATHELTKKHIKHIKYMESCKR